MDPRVGGRGRNKTTEVIIEPILYEAQLNCTYHKSITYGTRRFFSMFRRGVQYSLSLTDENQFLVCNILSYFLLVDPRISGRGRNKKGTNNRADFI